MVSILQESKNYGFIFDETTQKSVNLPFSRQEVKISPGEFVSSKVINSKIKNLYTNLLYLYKVCNFGDFKVPKESVFSLSGNNFELYETDYRRNITSSNTFFEESKRGALCYYTPDLGGFIIFYITNKRLLSTVIYNNIVQPLTNTTSIDPLSGSIEFGNISEVKVNKNNELYVVDNDYKNIYLYNIKNIVDYEPIYRNLPFIKSVVGGPGPQQENNKFNNINNIAVNSRFVIVEDNVNRCIKILDSNLNWLNTISLKVFFDTIGKFNSLAISEKDEVIGIKNRELYLFKLEENFSLNLVNTFDITGYIRENENVLSIEFSQQDKNVFYIFTDRAIKKAWSTNPSKCVGEYIPGNTITWGTVFIFDEQQDSIMIKTAGENNNGIILLGYKDFINISSLLTNVDFEIYSLDDLELKKEEYTSSWSYQKAFKKLYFNILTLLEEIKFRLVEDNDTISVIVDRIYNKLFLSFQEDFEEPYDLNIGINENFQAEVINRLIDQIYELQLTLLLHAVNNRTTKTFNSPAPEKNRPESLVYTYYVDESLLLNPSPARLAPFQDFLPLGGLSFTFGGAPYVGTESISVVQGLIN